MFEVRRLGLAFTEINRFNILYTKLAFYHSSDLYKSTSYI